MRVRIVLFPSLSPLLPPLNIPTRPLRPQKIKTMVASWLDEIEISWLDIENSLQPACFRFYLPWFCLCTSFLALRDVLAPSRAVFLHLCLFALATPQDAHSPIQSTWQTPVLSSRSNWNVACLHICLCVLFPHSLSPPPLLPYIAL